jgi:hypothetical protein
MDQQALYNQLEIITFHTHVRVHGVADLASMSIRALGSRAVKMRIIREELFY